MSINEKPTQAGQESLGKAPEEYSREHFEDPKHKELKKPFKQWLHENKKKVIILSIFAAAVIIALVLLLFLGKKDSFSGANVFLDIEAPTSVTSGGNVTYTFKVTNKEKIDLDETDIEIIFPEGFSYVSSTMEPKDDGKTQWSLGEVKSNREEKMDVTGTLTGQGNVLKAVKAVLTYSAKGYGSKFEIEKTSQTEIVSSGLSISIDAPSQMASGSSVEYNINYQNDSDKTISDIEIRTEYPQGFSYSEAVPSPGESNNIWRVSSLNAGEKGDIKIKGTLEGQKDEVKKVAVQIGTVSNREFFLEQTRDDATKIVEPGVLLDQVLKAPKPGIANLGDKLEYTLKYENQLGVALHEIVIVEQISNADVLDLKSLQASGGAYDNGKITWTGAGIPGLKLIQPGEKGQIKFSVNVKNKDQLKITSKEMKNLNLDSTMVLSSTDIPNSVSVDKKVTSEVLETKLNSYIILSTEGLYYDQFSGTPIGAGPIPPKVGQKTTYKIFLYVTNYTNNVKDAVVRATLAPGVAYGGNPVVSHGKNLEYNSRTGEVVWELGLVPANIGHFNDRIMASFDVSITPGEDKVGKKVDLVSNSQISGIDDFTSQEMKGSGKKLNTRLQDDKFMDEKKGVVVK